jgi:putative hydrolase of the HAD superfamily
VPTRFRAVFLDVGDTLLGVEHPETAYQAALARLELRFELEAIREATRVAREASWAEHRPGPQPPDYAVIAEEELAWRERLLRRLLAHLGVVERLEEARQAIWDCWVGPDLFQRFPEVADILDALRSGGYVVGAVSNWDPRLEQVIRNTGLREHFDFLVVSEVEGFAKPSPRLFRKALELAGVEPHEALHVGDNFACDVEGALGVGIQPAWLDRTGAGERDFAPTIPALDELPHLLAGLVPLRGQVVTGRGRARELTALPWVTRALEERFGWAPVPGTLNLRLVRPADLAAWAAIRTLPAASLSRAGSCDARLWPTVLADGRPAALIRPQVAGYPPDQVELLAPQSLRETLRLRDGDTLTAFAGEAS